MSEEIRVDHVVKKYGNATIIPDMSLQIKNCEFFTLLGPSGCGKTTLLRMIAGFNSIEGGEIRFGDRVINNVPAHKRNIGMVFQDYAIFPHLTVEENVRYGLKQHKVEKQESQQRLEEILKVTKIEEYRDRLPERLSGGQQQRVALARAIVIHPTVLLMDEPLSNLDAKLRVEMRSAIHDIQRKIGITTVYVTHDQEEALAISDRIALINKGEIQQVARPRDLYARPYNTFAADFIGHSDFFRGEMTGSGSKRTVRMNGGCSFEMDNIRSDAPNGKVIVGVRPEEFIIDEQGGLTAQVTKATFLGRYMNYVLAFENADVMDTGEEVELSQDMGSHMTIFGEGEKIHLTLNTKKINIFSEEDQISLIEGVRQYDE
ncbi:MAG: ABC transporter ATP-binding protein [Lawsonibacter sp.]|nr:ABC transporter ATP-binding protein [Lawsonibacter sp.]